VFKREVICRNALTWEIVMQFSYPFPFGKFRFYQFWLSVKEALIWLIAKTELTYLKFINWTSGTKEIDIYGEGNNYNNCKYLALFPIKRMNCCHILCCLLMRSLVQCQWIYYLTKSALECQYVSTLWLVYDFFYMANWQYIVERAW
jgi:hypothetical protein